MQFLVFQHDLFPVSVCSLGIDLRVNAVASVRPPLSHMCVCVRRHIRRVHYSSIPRQAESATGEQVALQGRGARYDGGRESILNVRAAVARIYMRACASRAYVSRSESKDFYIRGGTCSKRRATVGLFIRDYQKLPEIHLIFL